MEIIGVDHGYAAMKTTHYVFPSGVVDYGEHEPYTLQNTLLYNGKYYVCGSGRQPLLRDKTINDNYYLLTLAALAKEVRYRTDKRQEEIILAAGLPLASFGREKERFKQYLLRKKTEYFSFEGEPYEITISDVQLYPQGYAAILDNMELLKGEPSVVLADIGGWTMELMRLDNYIPNAATCRSLELGMIRCMDEILEQVRRSMGLSLTVAQVEAVLQDEPCSLPDKAKNIVLEYGEHYTAQLLSAIMECGFDITAMPVIFLGGGAGLIKHHISPKNALCRAIILEDTQANARGYERICAQQRRHSGHV